MEGGTHWHERQRQQHADDQPAHHAERSNAGPAQNAA
jgi:hypothetical protein